MSFTLRASLLLLALSLNLANSAPAQSQSSPPGSKSPPLIPSSSQSSAARALVEKYFSLYAAKDLDGLMSLWSEQSPDFESRKQAMQKLFAGYEKIEVKSPVVLRVTVEGEKARLRVDVEVNAVEAKTGKPAAGFGLRKHVMECVKEN